MSDTLFRMYSDPVTGARWWADWLYRLASGFATGDELIHCTPLGVNVDIWTCDKVLEGAERAGWVKRSNLAPSRSQQFFGIASVRRELWPQYAPPTWYGWEPGPKYAEAWRFSEARRK